MVVSKASPMKYLILQRSETVNIKLFAFFFCISLVLFNAGVYCSWAKAPDSAKIVFASNRSGNFDIYLMNPDGGGVVKLTDNPAGDFQPVFSPTGEQILFVSTRDGNRDLYLIDADGKNEEKVFSSSVDRSVPTWSPDGKRIAYLRYGEATLYTAEINGKNETPLAKTGPFGGHPAWSPDGETIVFTFGLGGKDVDGYPLVLISPQGNKRREVSPDPNLRLTAPAWSPDSEWIAFADFPWFLHEGDKGTIHIMKPDATNLKQIVPKAGGYAWDPTWSPRGDQILYEQEVGDQMQLFVIDLASRMRKQLTRGSKNIDADWFDPAALPVTPQSHLLTTTWGKLKQK